MLSSKSAISLTIQRYMPPDLQPSECHHTSPYFTILQNDINNWYNLHPDKCQVLTIGKQQTQISRKYILNESELVNMSEEKYLGVIIDNKLKFEDHIGEKVKRENTIFSLIQRSFVHLDFKLFKTIFISFVRPHHEYVSYFLAF